MLKFNDVEAQLEHQTKLTNIFRYKSTSYGYSQSRVFILSEEQLKRANPERFENGQKQENSHNGNTRDFY
jgi:hypothetical protein